MPKILVIYNFAQKYRTAIFKAIDKKWDCIWYFGENITDIKEMTKGSLFNEHYVKNHFIKVPVYWQVGIGNLIRKKDIHEYLILGDLFCLSTWWLLIQKYFIYRQKKVYLWSHGWYGRESFIKKILKRAFFGMADHTFTYGEYAKRIAIKQGFEETKLSAIHNSLDHSAQVLLRNSIRTSNIYKFHFNNDKPTLIFIGRLTKVKRLDMVLSAIAQLKEEGKLYNFVIIGDGEERANLEYLTKSLNLTENVWFYGQCYDDNQNAQLIYDADLCVSPGNVGLTAMHTMVFGTPVLTHNNFPMQMPEFEAIQPGKTGDFFEYGNVESLADSIFRWFDLHKNARNDIRKWCYEEIDNYWSPEYQIKVLSMVLDKI